MAKTKLDRIHEKNIIIQTELDTIIERLSDLIGDFLESENVKLSEMTASITIKDPAENLHTRMAQAAMTEYEHDAWIEVDIQ